MIRSLHEDEANEASRVQHVRRRSLFNLIPYKPRSSLAPELLSFPVHSSAPGPAWTPLVGNVVPRLTINKGESFQKERLNNQWKG